MRDTIKHSLAPLLGLLLLLTGCGSRLPDPMEVYELDRDSVVALDTIIGEEEGHLVQILGPEDELAEETKEEDQIDDTVNEGAVYVYHYKQVPSPMALVQSYMETLTAEDVGFVVTDKDNIIMEEVPELRNIRNRTLVLARPSVIRDQTFRIAIGWAEGTGTVYVALSHVEGEILLEPPVPEPEESEPADGEESLPPSDSVLTDQINYLYSQTPERLGLEGETMENYNIYYVEGMAVIDGETCHRFHVYARRQEDTNGILGAYFLSRDNQNLYRLDMEADTVTKLP